MVARDPAAPFLVVGLGNPGAEYDGTPHNFGFMAVDELARRCDIRMRTSEAQALTGRGELEGQPLWLAQPLTYMNLSGISVAQLLRKRAVTGWVVICDELDLPLGTLRLRQQGSAGSHNGLRSIAASLGTTGFARLRLGTGPAHPVLDRVSFVLGRWGRAQLVEARQVAATAADVVACIVREGMAAAMTRFNRVPREDDDE
ncbi:MAG: aminoacyl-tRNA hydrolase [Terriglobales bacterium]